MFFHLSVKLWLLDSLHKSGRSFIFPLNCSYRTLNINLCVLSFSVKLWLQSSQHKSVRFIIFPLNCGCRTRAFIHFSVKLWLQGSNKKYVNVQPIQNITLYSMSTTKNGLILMDLEMNVTQNLFRRWTIPRTFQPTGQFYLSCYVF